MTPRRARPWLLAIGALLALAPPPAGAQPKKGADDVYGEDNVAVEEARKYFSEGVRLSAAGKVAEALDQFQKAYDLVPNWKILYNIGQTSRHVRDHARSLKAFERYLAEGKDEITKPRRTEVEREIATLKPLVGRLEVTANEDGATVTVDDKPVGRTPLGEPVLVNAGKRRVKATREGMKPFQQEVDVKGGGRQALEIRLEPAGGATPPPTATATSTAKPPDSPPRDWSGFATAAWIGAGVFTAGAVATGTIALIDSGSFVDTPYGSRDRKPPPDSDLQNQADRIATLAVVTDVLVGAAVVSAGLGIYFTFFAGGSSAPPASGKSGKAAVTDVRLRATPGGAVLTGRF